MAAGALSWFVAHRKDLLWVGLVVVAIWAARSWFTPPPQVVTVRHLVPLKVVQPPPPQLAPLRKLTTVTQAPIVLNFTAPHEDPFVLRYCEVAQHHDSTPGVAPPPDVLALRAVQTNGHTVTAWGSSALGVGSQAVFHVQHPHPWFEAIAAGDSVVVHERRTLNLFGLTFEGLGIVVGGGCGWGGHVGCQMGVYGGLLFR